MNAALAEFLAIIEVASSGMEQALLVDEPHHSYWFALAGPNWAWPTRTMQITNRSGTIFPTIRWNEFELFRTTTDIPLSDVAAVDDDDDDDHDDQHHLVAKNKWSNYYTYTSIL